MASATVLRLSKNDSSVLSAIFDPEASLTNSVQIDYTPSASATSSNLTLSRTATQAELRSRERSALLLLNKESPHKSEIESAILTLSSIIDQDAGYASAYTNRAQALRLLSPAESIFDDADVMARIFADLSRAVEISTPGNPMLPVPAAHARVLASAHTHRAYLLLSASKSDTLAEKLTTAVDGLGGFGRQELEEMASREFGLGGRYGNDTARQMAVKTNPYAKLCGSIVREAMTKEVREWYEQQEKLRN